jgi:hypothetical protein
MADNTKKPYHQKPFKSSAFFGTSRIGDCIICCAFFPFQGSDLGSLKNYELGHEKTDSTYYHASTRTMTADRAFAEIMEFEHENRKIYKVVDPNGAFGPMLPEEYKPIAHVMDFAPQVSAREQQFAQVAADKRTEDALKKIERIRKSGPYRPKP